MPPELKRNIRRASRSARRVLRMDAEAIHPDIPDGAKVLIHVGKSGGTSLRKALQQTPLGQEVHSVHIRRPPIRSSLSYYIVARGPISRAVSAFNWRYKLVVTDGAQRDRVPGEFDLLTRYETLNNLAHDLYAEDGTPNGAVIDAFGRMHHIRENIAFYLDPLLDRIDPGQIREVLMQENLNADIERVLGVRIERRDKQHGDSVDPARKALDPRAQANLRRFLARDFACLNRLYCWGKIDQDTYIKTL
ncbi:MAG: hypothetical protein KDA50_00635 [Rhodobacteraceae bacterium]|nr:hypothetical protein [Paracoccaceae bacterium]